MLAVKSVTKVNSTPSFFDFDPTIIPYQYRVVYDIKHRFIYDDGPHYIMLSGSVGSAKSTLLAWLSIKHCTQFNGARCMLGRKSMVDLRDTIFQEILEMLEGINGLKEGVDYWVNQTRASIKFKNGSEIISRSWHDKKFKKFRSLKLSMIVIEELTENDKKDWQFFIECIARLGRLPHVPENVFIAATNPDDPSHEAYKFFIKGSKKKGYYAVKDNNIHTYYSITSQNPFLPKWYISALKKKYDAKMVKRLLYGIWLYIKTDVIYYEYNHEIHKVEGLKLKKRLPIRLSFDFNISVGNPMSSCLLQVNKNAKNTGPHDRKYNFLDEVAIEGARTADALDEWQGKGVFDYAHNPKIIVHGDASGRYGDSKSKQSDYDIIEKYLANYVRKDGEALNYEIEVPNANPPLRSRHNISNGQLKNSDGEIAVAVDSSCENIDNGFSNTRLKEGAQYLEDQTTEGQDISTAVTYAIWYVEEHEIYEDEDDITFA